MELVKVPNVVLLYIASHKIAIQIFPIVSNIQMTKVTRALTATVLVRTIRLLFDKLFIAALPLIGSTWL
jgi:hypothetical protein